MKRLILWTASALSLFVVPEALEASGDWGCGPSWKLASPDYACENLAVLSPGNDTRVNLLYLLRDRAGLSTPGRASYPELDYGTEGFGHVFLDWDVLLQTYYGPPHDEDYTVSRCQTVGTGADAFLAALDASSRLPAGEKAALADARKLAGRSCGSGGEAAPQWPAAIVTRGGRDFLAYLQGADAFYAGRFDEARGLFAGLRKAKDHWLAETSAYMVARNELAAALEPAIDEWGDYAGAGKVDKAAVVRGQAALDAYLKAYPKGMYAQSAHGLVRRALWLAGDARGLSRVYASLLGSVAVDGDAAPLLVQEVDNKLLFAPGLEGSYDAPLLLATWDLLHMRVEEVPEGEQPWGDPPISAEEIAAQKAAFTGSPDLYAFVQANHAYYVGRDYRKVLELLPDDARRESYSPLAFSRQVLRGLALEALGDRNAAGFWQQLLGGARDLYQRPVVELALAMNWERQGKLADVFAKGSPISEAPVREILLQNSAGPNLLRAVANRADVPRHERDVAIFVLLYNQLSRGHYAGFVRDLALVPKDADTTYGAYDWNLQELSGIPNGLYTSGNFSDDYPCPTLAKTAATLAAGPGDVKARLCLGDFYRLNGFDDLVSYASRPGADELGGAVRGFTEKEAPRAAFYASIIDDPAASGSDKAYALFRAVWCYGPSGNNSCGGEEVPQETRKAWFRRLKSQYASSRWAQELKYYW